jgi:hypothetical protein
MWQLQDLSEGKQLLHATAATAASVECHSQYAICKQRLQAVGERQHAAPRSCFCSAALELLLLLPLLLHLLLQLLGMPRGG